MVKYTTKQKIEILDFYHDSHTYEQTQERYGISPNTLKSWLDKEDLIRSGKQSEKLSSVIDDATMIVDTDTEIIFMNAPEHIIDSIGLLLKSEWSKWLNRSESMKGHIKSVGAYFNIPGPWESWKFKH